MNFRGVVHLLMVGIGASLCGGCATSPKYLERTSEALSRSIYATGDSLILGRVELAKSYNEQAEKLTPPPKQRIQIDQVSVGSTKAVTVPASYKNAAYISESQDEYKQLVKVTEEKKALEDQAKVVDSERQNQDEIHSALLRDFVQAQVAIEKLGKKVAQKNLVILSLSIIIALILLSIGASFYFKLARFALI